MDYYKNNLDWNLIEEYFSMFEQGQEFLKLKGDFRKLSKNRINPFMVKGNMDLDRVLEFLNEFNAFINHTPKSFRKIIDKNMRL